jgi:hypothetical protein
MQIEPLSRADLTLATRHIEAALDGPTLAAWRRIVGDPHVQLERPADTPAYHAVACDVAAQLGIPLIDGPPAEAFSWDGTAIRSQTEASVLLHEVAHWQLCPASRIHLPDFGLGAGPETGRRHEADAARAVDELTEVREEQRASLLGILWEAHLGLPALFAFLEQNWFEGWRRGAAATHFRQILDELSQLGLTTADGIPKPRSIRV